jgi:hypothetical protein
VLRPAFDEGSATVGDMAHYVQPYKKYIANLTQSGSNTPTALEFENTLGVTISYNYDTTGDYSLTASASIFSQYYTWIIISTNGIPNTQCYAAWVNDTTIRIRTTNGSSATNGLLEDTAIEIRVYEMPPP